MNGLPIDLFSKQHWQVGRQVDPPDLIVVVSTGRFDVRVMYAAGGQKVVKIPGAAEGGGVVVASAEPNHFVSLVGFFDIRQRGGDRVGRGSAAVDADVGEQFRMAQANG